ncbi:MAG: TGS domain-containing protein, partial [Bacteroidales bacterium]|nr:TGS domain-containing protein [Bacteroidales bacterium]
MIKITLPDGSVKEFNVGTTPYEIALSISEGLARNVLAAKADDTVVGLDYKLENNTRLTLLTWND